MRCTCSSEGACFGRSAGQSSAGSGKMTASLYCGKFHRLRVRRSTRLSGLHFRTAFTPPPQKKRLSSFLYGQKINTSLLGSTNSDGVKPFEARRSGSGWNRDACSRGWEKDPSDPERTATVKCIKAKQQNFNHTRLYNSGPESHPVGYKTQTVLWAAGCFHGVQPKQRTGFCSARRQP